MDNREGQSVCVLDDGLVNSRSNRSEQSPALEVKQRVSDLGNAQRVPRFGKKLPKPRPAKSKTLNSRNRDGVHKFLLNSFPTGAMAEVTAGNTVRVTANVAQTAKR